MQKLLAATLAAALAAAQPAAAFTGAPAPLAQAGGGALVLSVDWKPAVGWAIGGATLGAIIGATAVAAANQPATVYVTPPTEPAPVYAAPPPEGVPEPYQREIKAAVRECTAAAATSVAQVAGRPVENAGIRDVTYTEKGTYRIRGNMRLKVPGPDRIETYRCAWRDGRVVRLDTRVW